MLDRLRETAPDAAGAAVSRVRKEESVALPPPAPSKRLFWGGNTMEALSPALRENLLCSRRLCGGWRAQRPPPRLLPRPGQY